MAQSETYNGQSCRVSQLCIMLQKWSWATSSLGTLVTAAELHSMFVADSCPMWAR